MDPILQTIISDLTSMATRSIAQTIATRITDLKTRKDKDEAIQELIQIIHELIEERDRAITIAQTLKEQLTAQQISDENIQYITSTLLPLFIKFTKEEEMKELIESLINKNTLSVLQIMGFNYKTAIGDPLTEVVRNFLLSQGNSSTNKQITKQRRG